MMFTHSTLKPLLVALILVVSAGKAAAADDAFPRRPIHIVVNTAPGGYADLMARLAAQHMSTYLKQPVIVENRAGGGGVIAVRFVKAAAADGYTVLATTGTAVQQMALRLEPGYDVRTDFAPIGIISRAPFVMDVPSSAPEKTMAEFVARAKANPNRLSYASAGVGTVPHFAIEKFLKTVGAQVRHIPYKGNAPAIPDVISGRVDMIFDTYAATLGQIKAGQLRALGVTSAKRLPALPNVPTLAEQGVRNYSYYTWTGIMAPAGTPASIVQSLSQALRYATSQAAVKDRFLAEGMESMSMSPSEFKQFLIDEVTQSQRIVKDLGLRRQ